MQEVPNICKSVQNQTDISGSYLSVTYFQFQYLSAFSLVFWRGSQNVNWTSDSSIRKLRQRRTSQHENESNTKALRGSYSGSEYTSYVGVDHKAATFISNIQTYSFTNKQAYKHSTLYINTDLFFLLSVFTMNKDSEEILDQSFISSSQSFLHHLKTFLFWRSFTDILLELAFSSGPGSNDD